MTSQPRTPKRCRERITISGYSVACMKKLPCPDHPTPSPAPASGAETREDRKKAAQQRKYAEDVLAGAEGNHIWLNAFSCIRPTDEFLIALGRQVLAYLDNPGATHQSLSGYLLDLPMREVVIRVNKS